MIAIILIDSKKEKPEEDSEQLPIATIHSTENKEYIFLDSSVITQVVIESLNRLERGEESLILIEIQVVPMSQRVRRGVV